MAKEYDGLFKLNIDLADWRMAMICCVTANAHRRKGSPALKPSDFIPKKQPKLKEKMTIAEMKDTLKSITLMMGGEVRI